MPELELMGNLRVGKRYAMSSMAEDAIFAGHENPCVAQEGRGKAIMRAKR